MRCLAVLLAAASAHAAVLSRDWAEGKLKLTLDDGRAQIDWLTPVAFRVSRTWGNDPPPVLRDIPHEKIAPEFTDAGPLLSMKTRSITLEIDRADMSLRVRSGDTPVANHLLVLAGNAVDLRLNSPPDERTFGDARFFFTRSGYGIYVLSRTARSIDYCFYYGPTPKEIFEQHALVIGADEVKSDKLDLLTRAQLPAQATVLAPAATIPQLVHQLIATTLTGVIYPAVDVAAIKDARARDLFTLLPLVFRSAGESGIDAATRARWRPYLITYLREAYDRGYPLIRPLPMQFWRDAASPQPADIFMLGDEVLLAPATGPKRKLDLPRGNWTDLRTNIEYKGRSTIEVDSPAGQVPAFVRNGWIVPFEFSNRMELHYFPSLGAEFFLWEPDLGENSQFHAAPAGDYVRVEIESKVARTYEWILHHTAAPREAAAESGALTRVAARDQLKPGAWWHDDKLNNLHLMVRAEAGKDLIVNMQ